MKNIYPILGLTLAAVAGLALLPSAPTPQALETTEPSAPAIDWQGLDGETYQTYYAPQMAMTPERIVDGRSPYGLAFTMPAAMAQGEPAPEPPAPEQITLGESMVQRLVVQRQIRDAVASLVADGVAVQVNIDLTPVVQRLDAVNVALASIDNRMTAALTKLDAIAAKPAPAGAGGLTPEQFKALTDSIAGVAQSLNDLGATVQGLVDQPLKPGE